MGISRAIFQLFGYDIIPKGNNNTYRDLRMGKSQLEPTWGDLANKRIAVPETLLNDIVDILKERRIVILVGGKDSGKTWLTYLLAFHIWEASLDLENTTNQNIFKRIFGPSGEREIFFAQIDEGFEADVAWDELERRKIGNNGQREAYVFVDDCHLEPNECEKFLKRLMDDNDKNLKVLFAMRKVGRVILRNTIEEDFFYSIGNKNKCTIYIEKNENYNTYIKNIIKLHIEVKKIYYEPSELELDSLTKRWGNNLYWIWLRLNAWKPEMGQKLNDIDELTVCKVVWEDNELQLQGQNGQVLLYLAIFCQFESFKVYELTDFLKEKMNVVKELVGIIEKVETKNFFFYTMSQSFSELILKTFTYFDTNYKYNNLNIQSNIFNNYIKSESRPPNWFSLFFELNKLMKKDKIFFANRILEDLVSDNDIIIVIRKNIQDLDLINAGKLIKILLIINRETKGISNTDLADIIETRKNKINQNDYDEIMEKMKSATAIKRNMYYTKYFFPLKTLFEQCIYPNFGNIIIESSMNSIELLFHIFFQMHAGKGVRMLVQSLTIDDMNCLLGKDDSSLYLLNQLMMNISNSDTRAAEIFINNKLSDMNLSKQLLNAESKIGKKIYTKGWNIRFLLMNVLEPYPKARKKIVNNIDDATWLELLKSVTSSSDRTFILWSLKESDVEKYNRIISRL